MYGTCLYAEDRFWLETRSCLSIYEPFMGKKNCLFRVEFIVEFCLKFGVEFIKTFVNDL